MNEKTNKHETIIDIAISAAQMTLRRFIRTPYYRIAICRRNESLGVLQGARQKDG